MLHRPIGRGALLVLILASPVCLGAQQRDADPSPKIVRILDAVPASGVLLSPDRNRLLILERAPTAPRAQTVGPELRLAGERISPRTNAQSRFPIYSALIVQPIGRGDVRRVVVPWQARITNPMWSPNGDWVAYTLVEDAGMSLWVAEAWNGESRMLSGPTLNGSFGNPCQWLPSSSGLLCAKLPAGRASIPVAQGAASAGGDLLRDAQDEKLFEHYFTDQLVMIPLSGQEKAIGTPGLHQDVQISPDGKYLLVETLHRPFSYKVSAGRFPSRTEVWELGSGSVVKALADRELRETTPASPDAVPAGPRAASWRNDAPASLSWVEALDGGDPSVSAKVRDRLYLLDAPFSGAPTKLADLEFRSRGVVWGRPTLALVSEGWSSGRARSWIVNPSRPGAAPRLLLERRSADRSSDPSGFVTRSGVGGAPVLMTSKDGRFAYVIGAAGSQEGGRPFVDRVDLTTGQSLRWIKGEPPFREQAVALLDPDRGRLIMRRESVNSLPNYYVRDVGAHAGVSAAGVPQ